MLFNVLNASFPNVNAHANISALFLTVCVPVPIPVKLIIGVESESVLFLYWETSLGEVSGAMSPTFFEICVETEQPTNLSLVAEA